MEWIYTVRRRNKDRKHKPWWRLYSNRCRWRKNPCKRRRNLSELSSGMVQSWNIQRTGNNRCCNRKQRWQDSDLQRWICRQQHHLPRRCTEECDQQPEHHHELQHDAETLWCRSKRLQHSTWQPESISERNKRQRTESFCKRWILKQSDRYGRRTECFWLYKSKLGSSRRSSECSKSSSSKSRCNRYWDNKRNDRPSGSNEQPGTGCWENTSGNLHKRSWKSAGTCRQIQQPWKSGRSSSKR